MSEINPRRHEKNSIKIGPLKGNYDLRIEDTCAHQWLIRIWLMMVEVEANKISVQSWKNSEHRENLFFGIF